MKESNGYTLPDSAPEYSTTLEDGAIADISAEKVILGAIFLNNEAFFDDIADLNVGDFSLDAHRIIFSCMNDILFGQVEGINHVDMVTLSSQLKNDGKLSTVGGISYLCSLTEGLPRRINCEEYVRIVKNKAKLRSIMNICNTASARAAEQKDSAAEISADIQEQLIEEAAEGQEGAVRIGSVAPVVEERINKGRSIAVERTALELTWGVSGLDDFTKGAFAGEMTVLAGESGGFKSSLLTQMTLANAREGVPCCVFSLEMTKEKFVQRYYPAMGNIITSRMIRDPRLINLHTHIPEMRRLTEEMSKLPIWIDDSSPMHLPKLIARIRMMRRKHGIRLYGLDYMQLVKTKAKNVADRTEEVIFALRDLVKIEPTIHLLVLSQYSKAQGFVKKGRRTKGDLFGGSVIHHAAQNVLLITVENSENKQDNDLLDVEFMFDKQRDGKTGKVSCSMDRDHLRFMHPQPVLTH